MVRDTDNWPVVKARWFEPALPTQIRTVRVVVIHDMEYTEQLSAAEDVAHYFATTTRKASAHVCVDANSIIQCVRDRDIAYAAPGCNHDGIQIELAGFARQSRAEWLDDYGHQLLDLAARAVAQYCVKYTLPPYRLTDEQLRSGMQGIVGHDQVSRVYKQSDHMDPGPNFPWDHFIERTQRHFLDRLNPSNP